MKRMNEEQVARLSAAIDEIAAAGSMTIVIMRIRYKMLIRLFFNNDFAG